MISSMLLIFAWPTDYPGFVHFHDWDGGFVDLQQALKLPDGSQLPVGLSKDYCALDSICDTFGGYAQDGRYIRQMNVNQSTDMYLAFNSSVIAGTAICKMEGPGCGTQDTWLACENDCFTPLTTFALPPDLLHSSCVENPSCIGFLVFNDGTHGTLFAKSGAAAGWFSLPTGKQSKRLYA